MECFLRLSFHFSTSPLNDATMRRKTSPLRWKEKLFIRNKEREIFPQMLFRCYSWGPSSGEVRTTGIALSVAQRENPSRQQPQTLPSGDLIFCRFSFPPSLCIIKSRRIVREKKKKEGKKSLESTRKKNRIVKKE